MADKQQQKPQQQGAQQRNAKPDGKPRTQQGQQGGNAKKPQQAQNGASPKAAAQQPAQRKPQAAQNNAQPKPQAPAFSAEHQAAIDSVHAQLKAAGVQAKQQDVLAALKSHSFNVELTVQNLKSACLKLHSIVRVEKLAPGRIASEDRRATKRSQFFLTLPAVAFLSWRFPFPLPYNNLYDVVVSVLVLHRV
jgi:hypothetical protein